jgi:hypothetical protein
MKDFRMKVGLTPRARKIQLIEKSYSTAAAQFSAV